ncbi:hypothetical protein MBLNU457_6918t1 [Dothideomycetes sp. NU457]
MDFPTLYAHARRVRHSLNVRRLGLRSLTTTTRVVPQLSQDAMTPGTLPATSQTLLTFQPQTLHSYNISTPPNPSQLRYANHFFTHTSTAPLLWSTPQFRSIPSASHPEVCFLGRSNVGKSSLLNALFDRPSSRPAHVSKKAGRTRTMNAFGVGALETHQPSPDAYKNLLPGGLVVVDMPGYGAASREEWGREIMKYLEGRKQLRRTFVLVDAEHGLKGTDKEILTFLARQGIGHQVLLSKVDKILFPGPKAPSAGRLSRNLMMLREIAEGIRQEVTEAAEGRMLGDIICCSSEKEVRALGGGNGKMGIDAVRWAALSACGLESDEHGRKKSMQTYGPIVDVEGSQQEQLL